MIAASGTLYPILAMRTLLVFLTFNKIKECFVAFSFIVRDLVLLARLALVGFNSAIKTIVFLA